MAEEGMPLCTKENMRKVSETLEEWKTLPEADIFNVTREHSHMTSNERVGEGRK